MSGKAADLTTENPHLISAGATRRAQNAAQRAEFSETADRLLGLLRDTPIDVCVTDAVSIAFYPPSDDEYMEIIRIKAGGLSIASKSRGFKVSSDSEERAFEEAIDLVESTQSMLREMNVILAKLAVDPDLNEAFFAALPRQHKATIVKALTARHNSEVEKAKKFRKPSKRAESRANVNGLGADTV